jgi:hypothetical protein
MYTLYKDIESGDIIFRNELEREYKSFKESGNTEAETFGNYISNCTTRNGGTLQEITVSENVADLIESIVEMRERDLDEQETIELAMMETVLQDIINEQEV